MGWTEKLERYVREREKKSMTAWLMEHGIRPQTWQLWKNGTKPSYRYIRKIVRATNGYVTCEDILFGD